MSCDIRRIVNGCAARRLGFSLGTGERYEEEM